MKKSFLELKNKLKRLMVEKKLIYEKNYARIGVNTDDNFKQTTKISNFNNNH